MIWVLTAGFGDGHNSAAKCVAEALRPMVPGEDVLVSDFIHDVHPILTGLSHQAYRFVITHHPGLWKMAYGWFAQAAQADTARLAPTMITALDAFLEREQPRVIVSTYPIYSNLLEVLRQRGRRVPPLVTVVTDSITVHPSWTVAPSDLTCVADDETKAEVLRLGVHPEKVAVTGFPVSLRFLENEDRHEQTVRVLYMPSTPAAHFAATMEAFRPLMNQGVHFTIQTGRNAPAYYQSIRRFTDAHPTAPVEVLGWTDQIPRLLKTHDVLVCKAGGAILHEALAACIPAVINYVVPGQEEGNAEYLTGHGCALRSHSPAETAAQLQRLLDNHLALAKTMRAGMRPLSIPDAAQRIAKLALAQAH